jgi:spore coat polysaccharide biosynthesis protein SpsF (cytidylyltransferase family)
VIAAIVQARLGSKRLPRKTLAAIEGQPLIWYVLERLRRAATLEAIMVATSDLPIDDELKSWLDGHGVDCFRGSEQDVLDRCHGAAKAAGADTVVRITGDCPLIMPDVVDRVVREFQKGGADYVGNTHPPTFPDGLDTEVFSFAALERAWKEAAKPSDREHVTPYLYTGGLFTTRNVAAENQEDWSRVKWSVDLPEDLERVRAIYRKLGNDAMSSDWRAIVTMFEGGSPGSKLSSARPRA